MLGSIFLKDNSNPHILPVRESFEDYSPIKNLIPELIALEQERLDIQKSFTSAIYLSEAYSSEEILNEGVSDFFTGVVNFIKKVISAVKEFVNTFFARINSKMMDTEKFIKKYRKELENLDPSFEFQTHKFDIDEKEPNFMVGSRLVDEYNRELASLHTTKPEDIRQKMTEDIRNNVAGINRARLLGKSVPMSAEEVADEYKTMVYGKEGITIIVNKGVYMSYVNGFKDIRKKAAGIKRDNDIIIRSLEDMKSFFMQGPSAIHKDGKEAYSARRLDYNEEKNKISRNEEEEVFDRNGEKGQILLDFFNRKYTDVNSVITLVNTLLGIKSSAIRDELSDSSKIIKMGFSKGEKGED